MLGKIALLGTRHAITLLVMAGKYFRPLGHALSPFGRPLRQTPETWARQYTGGHWDYLETLLELGRYSTIAGYVIRLKPGGAVLDVGCGEGILQRALRSHYGLYLGIDIAADAVRRAAEREDAVTTFRTACALTFEPEEQFDAIVFNEVLYYFDDPASLLRRYEKSLRSDGIFVLSTSVFAKCLPVWRAIESVLCIEDEVVVFHRRGYAWVVQLARPCWRGS